jgi:hypothetical protein
MERILVSVFLLTVFTVCFDRDALSETISSPNAPAAIGPTSQTVRVGDILFLSGQQGVDPITEKFAGQAFEAQARQALENQKAILEAAGFFPERGGAVPGGCAKQIRRETL